MTYKRKRVCKGYSLTNLLVGLLNQANLGQMSNTKTLPFDKLVRTSKWQTGEPVVDRSWSKTTMLIFKKHKEREEWADPCGGAHALPLMAR